MEQHLKYETEKAGLHTQADINKKKPQPGNGSRITGDEKENTSNPGEKPEKDVPEKPAEKPEKPIPETEKPDIHEMPKTRDNPEVEKTDIEEVPDTEITELPDTGLQEIPDTSITEMPDQTL